MKDHWEVDLNKTIEENGWFGHNCEPNIRRFLRKIEKLGSVDGRVDGLCMVDIQIVNEYTVKITLPADYDDGAKYRENILLAILTTSPMPSECKFNKKKDQLTLEWHY
jgi:hypothetical protein